MTNSPLIQKFSLRLTVCRISELEPRCGHRNLAKPFGVGRMCCWGLGDPEMLNEEVRRAGYMEYS